MVPPLKLPSLNFSRTKLMAIALGLLQLFQETGVIDLSPETLRQLSIGLGAAALWFLRSAIERLIPSPGNDAGDGTHQERLPYEAPTILRRGSAGLSGPSKSRRRLALGGVLVAAGLSVGCGHLSDIYQAAAGALAETPSAVLEDVEAVVTSQPEHIDGSQLAGRAFTARVDGQDIPVICMAELEARCSRFQTNDRIDIDKAFLRTGAIEIAGVLYRTYLEIARCRRARS